MTDQAQIPKSRLFSAGQLSLQLDGQTLNHISWNGHPLVRMAYAAVRGEAWDTVGPEVSNILVSENDSGFQLEWTADYRSGEIDLSARINARASADGRLAIEFDSKANRAFSYARIGLCVLLPWQTYCGKPYVAALGGVEVEGVIPSEIAKQYFVDGCYTPSIPPFTRFEVRPEAGVQISMEFEGDEFEMEDQRNWTDSTLKIYSTPLHLGNLHHAAAGQRIRQVVTINARGAQPASSSIPNATVRLELGAPAGHKVPSIGTTWPRAQPPSAATLPAIGLSHLRLDIDLAADQDFAASPLPPSGIPLELALWVAEPSLGRLGSVLAWLKGRTITRIIVNDAEADVTPPTLIRAAKAAAVAAGCIAPVGGGSDFWFAEINRVAHDFNGIDFLSFTVSPQLHVFDDESIMEGAAVQGLVVDAAKQRVTSGEIVLSPITLIARDQAKDRQRQPHDRDVRHGSDFLTAWTAASLVNTIGAGAGSLTYYELAGPNGLFADDGGAGSLPYPLLHLLQTVARRADQSVVRIVSSAPQAMQAIAVGEGDDLMVLIVNCGPDRRIAEVSSLPDFVNSQRRFAKGKADAASPFAADVRSGSSRIRLDGYEVLLLEPGRQS